MSRVGLDDRISLRVIFCSRIQCKIYRLRSLCDSFARSGSVEQVQCGIDFLYQTFDFVALVRAEVIRVQPLD